MATRNIYPSQDGDAAGLNTRLPSRLPAGWLLAGSPEARAYYNSLPDPNEIEPVSGNPYGINYGRWRPQIYDALAPASQRGGPSSYVEGDNGNVVINQGTWEPANDIWSQSGAVNYAYNPQTHDIVGVDANGNLMPGVGYNAAPNDQAFWNAGMLAAGVVGGAVAGWAGAGGAGADAAAMADSVYAGSSAGSIGSTGATEAAAAAGGAGAGALPTAATDATLSQVAAPTMGATPAGPAAASGSWLSMSAADAAKLALATYGITQSASAQDDARDAMNRQNELADEAQRNQMSILDQQMALVREVLDFNRQSYEEQRARQAELDVLNKEVVGLNLDLARKNAARADETHDFYMNVGRPMVQRTFDDANNWDSAQELNNVSARARASVQKEFDASQQQNNRMLARMGIAPNSGRFAALNNQIAMQRASGITGATTAAVEGRKKEAVGLRQQASNLAQGFPAQSLGQGAQASGTSSNATNVAADNANRALTTASTALAGMGQGAGIMGNVANGYGNIVNQANSNAYNQASISSANAAGWGNLAGWALSGLNLADGGKVEGPGTGTSDSVPAVNVDNGQQIRLSNGEYVIPADVVKALGTRHFDGLIKKYHKPVNVRG